eukprot:GHUV01019267.1.p1 GENE.GHUV01019267.1~~GHUV01019267.1.p1  ORF type:complete len:388 (+),score=88.38 GHUV01019267.1:192-1355(+)
MVLPSEPAGPSPRTIQEGDLVVIYESFNSIKFAYVDKKSSYVNRFGTFQHKDWLGVPYGSKVHCKAPGKGWVYLLAPTPELWTQVLKHRTQILYVADISVVVANLALMPGKVVLESGTGSGSLTHSLARAIAPTGHVHTFDFHEVRANEARSEFEKHGLGKLITVQHRNIEEQGFPETLAGQADAVFLDLPGPWKVVVSAAQCVKPGGMFCSFSPCIEQVQRTCERLDQLGFTDIRTLEILLRMYEVSTESLHTNAATVQQPNKQNKKRSRSVAAAATAAAAADGGDQPAAAAVDRGFVSQVLAKPVMDARGHTGYLTFARRFVAALPIDAENHQHQQQQNGHLDPATATKGAEGSGAEEQQQQAEQQQPADSETAAAADAASQEAH